MANFSIHCDWESALHEAVEIRETSARLKITVGNTAVTRNEDIWSRTVRDPVRLSAYPLALWFASSWWRLRWEPLPNHMPNHSWRMAHELAAAGYGYLWPKMLFASDGENIEIWATQSLPAANTAVRYLSDANSVISGQEFERSIDQFIDTVLARLDSVGLRHTILSDLWEEITAEREDADITAYRRLEARLGFDPDDCPEELHSQFSGLIPEIGANAIAEIAPVCASSDPKEKLREITDFAASQGFEGCVDIDVQGDTHNGREPWQCGRSLAQKTRTLVGLNGGVVDDSRLCGLLGLSKEVINSQFSSRPPLAMAVRLGSLRRSKFLLSKRNRCGRRFELARLLCDHLLDNQNDVWLPATNAKTARQKVQRAFAAEFLCPIKSMVETLDEDFSEDAIDDVAEHFGVSQIAVTTQLVNHGILSRTMLDDYDGRLTFPYSISTKNAIALER